MNLSTYLTLAIPMRWKLFIFPFYRFQRERERLSSKAERGEMDQIIQN